MLFNSWVALTYSGRCYTFVQYVVTFVQCRKQTLKLRENTIVLLRKSLTKHPPIFYLLNEWKVKIYFRECDIMSRFSYRTRIKATCNRLVYKRLQLTL